MNKIYITKIQKKYIPNAIRIMATDSTCKYWQNHIRIEELKTQPYAWVLVDFTEDTELAEDFQTYIPKLRKLLRVLK